MIKAVTFDVWNTLLRLDVMRERMAEGIAEVVGRDPLEMRLVVEELVRDIKTKRQRLEVADPLKASWEMLAERLECRTNDIKNGVARGLLRVLEDPEPLLFSDTLGVIRSLRDEMEKLAVIGNVLLWPGNYTRAILERLGIAEYMDLIVFADEAGAMKPDRRLFLNVLKELGVEPSEAIHVGDGIIEDLGGALSSGMKAAIIRPGAGRTTVIKELGVAIIPNIGFLPEAIYMLNR